jgi:hypothetical protein
MITIASRRLRSSPHRDASQTWVAIVELLTRGTAGDAKTQLLAVSGVAASIIADRGPRTAPIVVTCEGPRTRIYCAYDDDAIGDSESNEDALGFDPLRGEWSISLPCQEADLSWVQKALAKYGDRITARDLAAGLSDVAKSESAHAEALIIDPQGFLGR